MIKSEAFRCKTITTDLLDFSRIRTGEREPRDAADIVRSAANLISHQKRGNGIVQAARDRAGPAARLCRRRPDAAGRHRTCDKRDRRDADGGTLTFRASSQGNRVVIEVEDTGHGIPQENVSKIFEPFFTTKEVGKGTGLGLAVCYGIITEHGGRISVRSTVGKGTTFSIFLPVIDRIASLPSPNPNLWPRLLVVDDEKNLRLVVEKEMARQGHDVACAEDGEAAWATARGAGF